MTYSSGFLSTTMVHVSSPLARHSVSTARNPQTVGQVLYDVAGGRGCSPSGGPPFGRTDAETAGVVNTIDTLVRANFGHAGPRFIRFLVARRDDWDAWRSEYERLKAVYVKKAADDPVAGRFATYFAALEVTAQLAHLALEFEWDHRPIFATLWKQVASEASEADRATTALAHVLSWAQRHREDFWDRHETTAGGTVRVPNAGWAGAWDPTDDWDLIAFLPHRLKQILIGFSRPVGAGSLTQA